MSAPHEDDRAPRPPDGESEPGTPFANGQQGSESPGDGSDDGLNDGLDAISEILRERFQQAVAGLEPGPGTLEYLRRAVPARRRRRHAALAATAVSVFAVSAGATLAARSSFDSGPSETGGTAVGNLMSTATNDVPGGGSGHGPGTPVGGQDMSSGGSVGTETPSSPASVPGSTTTPLSATTPSITATGSPLAPLCQNSTVTSVAATQNSTTGGVTYETFQGTAKAVCTLEGMPGLTVTGAGGAPAKIQVHPADQTVAPLLLAVPAGQTLVLQPGERFEFQLAWVPRTCPTSPPPTNAPTSVPPSTGSPTQTASSAGPTPTGATSSPSSQPTPSGTPASSSVPGASIYSVLYSVYGSQPTQSVSFRADCGAAVYATAYFAAPGQRMVAQPTSAATSTSTS
ncbi:conserved hypothetical protein [Catenulispora acidiphila DSM 44928]|uniref:DUF4232 domain-containing protein n=1 Tax=Catenulispora acidiphila (strain DSM 44928 / JCM 14897 / NBRC 102108 / NRRL B-24433 / ID139908) TaxID=479433 RepID=C7Q5M4_CATAD|nr:hypothetical protein [Catenulispora acidiphila]ACU77835.1 conserved hypothetical protein [Catenulispora acidiphila DSM 44928]